MAGDLVGSGGGGRGWPGLGGRGSASGVGRMGEVVRWGAGAWCRQVEREWWWLTMQINILQAFSRFNDAQIDV